ncbi:uncharacterized protein LOC126661995 [Mercurialis annua]|uniref:uncharacterized protein LOC126661995 n=1 Tax=Mercurialis annua TaxID=3986 RepID=UPI00215F6952|nr:uncharacterized protein LOC126661995 [Mercurialis annua]
MEKFYKMDLMNKQREKNQASTIHHLETQISQMAIALQGRTQCGFSSTTENNPREQLKAVKLRSGRNLEKSNGKRHRVEEEEPNVEANVASSSQELPTVSEEVVIEVEEPYVRSPSFIPFVPKVPFPSRLRKAPDNHKLHNCSPIILSYLPAKLKDPGSFTIPCTIGNMNSINFLCDLGACINLMPLFLFWTLFRDQPMNNTSMVLQLADHSLKKPFRIFKDVLVKVDKFIFLVDIVI